MGRPDTYADFPKWRAGEMQAKAIEVLGREKPLLLDALLESCWATAMGSALRTIQKEIEKRP